MNTEDFVTYAQAVRLKECGFNEPCRYYYNSNQILFMCAISLGTTNNRYLAEIANGMTTVPTLAQAAKWLRDKHNLHVQIESVMGKRWAYTLVDTAPQSDMEGEYYDRIPNRDCYPVFDTYESAMSAGINAALELI